MVPLAEGGRGHLDKESMLSGWLWEARPEKAEKAGTGDVKRKHWQRHYYRLVCTNIRLKDTCGDFCTTEYCFQAFTRVFFFSNVCGIQLQCAILLFSHFMPPSVDFIVFNYYYFSP